MIHLIIEILRFNIISPVFQDALMRRIMDFSPEFKWGIPLKTAPGIKQPQDAFFGKTKISQAIMFPDGTCFPCSPR